MWVFCNFVCYGTVWEMKRWSHLKITSFTYQLCAGPLSGSQWWQYSLCQWGLGWLHPCDEVLVQPCRDPCSKRQKHTSPGRRKQTWCGEEDGRKRSLHHEATSRNKSWKSRKQERDSCVLCTVFHGLYLVLFMLPSLYALHLSVWKQLKWAKNAVVHTFI